MRSTRRRAGRCRRAPATNKNCRGQPSLRAPHSRRSSEGNDLLDLLDDSLCRLQYRFTEFQAKREACGLDQIDADVAGKIGAEYSASRGQCVLPAEIVQTEACVRLALQLRAWHLED